MVNEEATPKPASLTEVRSTDVRWLKGVRKRISEMGRPMVFEEAKQRLKQRALGAKALAKRIKTEIPPPEDEAVGTTEISLEPEEKLLLKLAHELEETGDVDISDRRWYNELG